VGFWDKDRRGLLGWGIQGFIGGIIGGFVGGVIGDFVGGNKRSYPQRVASYWNSNSMLLAEYA
jgi:fructose-specific phosphotransferase system IIC component